MTGQQIIKQRTRLHYHYLAINAARLERYAFAVRMKAEGFPIVTDATLALMCLEVANITGDDMDTVQAEYEQKAREDIAKKRGSLS